jgi:hypothetical protein
MSYWLEGRGKILLFSTASRPGAISQGLKLSGREAITHLYLVLVSKMVELHLHCPLCLHGLVLDLLIRGTVLPY